MKKVNLIMAFLMLISVLNACDDASQIQENQGSLNGEFKASFQEVNGSLSSEIYSFNSDTVRSFTNIYHQGTAMDTLGGTSHQGNVADSLNATNHQGTAADTLTGTYQYDEFSQTGKLFHANGQTQAFTCMGDSVLHIGNATYCNQVNGGHHNTFGHNSDSHHNSDSSNHHSGGTHH